MYPILMASLVSLACNTDFSFLPTFALAPSASMSYGKRMGEMVIGEKKDGMKDGGRRGGMGRGRSIGERDG